jgi:type 1 glutamine amidotransferase
MDCVLIAGGKYHDIDFARLELLKLLAEDERVRVRVFEDYRNVDAISSAHFLLSYTCDVIPGLEEQERLRSFVERGGRWLALHGTNSILRFLKSGEVDSRDWAPHFMETLGSMFIAHPPITPYQVTVADAKHPLVTGIEPFEATDELYLTKTYGDLHVLLDTEFEGEAVGFVKRNWQKARHPVFYLHQVGQGEVLYLTLGHCRSHYDMRPLMKWYPEIERGAWKLSVFHELLRRGISWAKQAQESGK